jgi:3-hydroxyacyl-[acyl-carrier-protein] dehydratase
MAATRKGALRLGSNLVEMLIPQRRPFLMVDCVDAFIASPTPSIETSRYISANEIYFAGHFPDLHLWPGSLTIEGMGQTAAVLATLLVMQRAADKEGLAPGTLLDGLRNLQLGFDLHPGHQPEAATRFLGWLSTIPRTLAVGAAVDVKLLRPVFAGQRLDYRVSLTTELGDLMRFDAEALVAGTPVASGIMTGAWMPRGPTIGGAR